MELEIQWKAINIETVCGERQRSRISCFYWLALFLHCMRCTDSEVKHR